MSYQIKLTPTAVQQIQKLAYNVKQQIAAKLQELTFNPRPDDAARLNGVEDLYKVRVEQYRIIYQIQEDSLSLTVVKAAHPRDY